MKPISASLSVSGFSASRHAVRVLLWFSWQKKGFVMSLAELFNRHEFLSRHIGPNDAERAEMLAAIGAPSIDALVDQTLPA
ncbi:hypothetical protein PWG14_21520, partial (plasmid) [Chromobacterium amazonense]|uniref:hypothetical protein n=1 Tax=Chromobacterium amazonense TaxID=1382803 RepID=UPI00237DC062